MDKELWADYCVIWQKYNPSWIATIRQFPHAGVWYGTTEQRAALDKALEPERKKLRDISIGASRVVFEKIFEGTEKQAVAKVKKDRQNRYWAWRGKVACVFKRLEQFSREKET